MSFLSCFAYEGESLELDVIKYFAHKRQERTTESKLPQPKKKRKFYTRRDPYTTTWFQNYVAEGGGSFSDVGHRDHALFRDRFRVPYSKFEEMVDECRSYGWWKERPDAVGNPGSPIELLMLGVLRILGRGWVFDDIYEATRISPRVIRAFFKALVHHYSSVLKTQWIKPDEGEDLQETLRVYENAGFPGCKGSVDCVHVWWDRCPVNYANVVFFQLVSALAQLFLVPKEIDILGSGTSPHMDN